MLVYKYSVPTELLFIMKCINSKEQIFFFSPNFIVKLDLWYNKAQNAIVWKQGNFAEYNFFWQDEAKGPCCVGKLFC